MSQAAALVDLDPVALLGLIKAEAGLNPKAERWGLQTAAAKSAIQDNSWLRLQAVIDAAWPDISFGYSQRIVLYHDQGDRRPTPVNCLFVREYVFGHEYEDLMAAAVRLKAGIERSLDGTPLGGAICYNAGSDKRDDPAWMAKFAGNVASYQRALEWAEQYRVA